MSNYTKLTDFASKDALPSGNAAKIVKGTEIDDEFQAIETAITTKANTDSPALSGTPTAPTAASGTNTTQIATTAYVQSELSDFDSSLSVGESYLDVSSTGEDGQVLTSDGAGAFTWADATPAGAVLAFAMATAPSGWLQCDGSAVSRTTYAVLFAAIGTTYGTGDGSTTFNLPDLRGEFVRGWDDARGVDSGRTLGSAQDMETRWYKAQETGANSPNDYVGGPYDGQVEGKDTNSSSYTMDEFKHNWDTSLETRPRNIALNYCIKA